MYACMHACMQVQATQRDTHLELGRGGMAVIDDEVHGTARRSRIAQKRYRHCCRPPQEHPLPRSLGQAVEVH